MREDNVRKIWSDAELDAALADLHDDVDEDDNLAFARASLMAAAGTAEEAQPRPRRRGTWRWITVAAAVVTLVGGLGIVVSLRPPAPEPARPATSLAYLDRPLAPGEFHYAQRLTWVPEIVLGKPVNVQRKVELWIPADPKGTWHRRTMWTGAIDGLPPGERADVNRAPKDEYGPAGVFPGEPRMTGMTQPGWNTPLTNWLSPDADLVASLSADPAKLVKRLLFDTIDVTEDGRAHTANEALTMVRMVLELGLAPKPVREGLRDALSGIAMGFAVPGQAPDGRPATVVGEKDTGQRLYFDPATAQLLAWDFPPGTPVTTTTRPDVPLSVPVGPPSSVGPPATTTENNVPFAPQAPRAPATLYFFAITGTSG
ncbi:hypothetical protein SAMN05421837_104708 [Amycolatopsis pretoriensis]|uniref:CU044_5270 family protein n=1 Tax=Amycolatopsis pretoriensis TaxID=218821 RepID=A0A1H5QWA1_9PSEU|nr:hypothetical protein [Amycolatopsis pretoriensis]SEF29467.1 hypothetical protein SAMN05421837_104708 [Amycolatopsis pretoriensis]